MSAATMGLLDLDTCDPGAAPVRAPNLEFIINDANNTRRRQSQLDALARQSAHLSDRGGSRR